MIEYIPLNKLVIWSDNPRYDTNDPTFLSGLSEMELMYLLWDQVSQKDMLALAKNLNENGFRESRLPIVVHEYGEYRVYDGNRRITCAKLISLRDNRLNFNTYNINETDEVLVTVVTKDQALEEMDEIHSGINGGRVIAWDSFTRDRSLYNRGKSPKYPLAFEFAEKVGISKKKDFGNTNYTDLQTILSNDHISEAIEKHSLDYSNQFNLLKNIKKRVKKPWSRYINEINNSEVVKKNFDKIVKEVTNNDKNIEKNNVSKDKKNKFELYNKEYRLTAYTTINLKDIIDTNLSTAELNKVLFNPYKSDLNMDEYTGDLKFDNYPGEYNIYVSYMEQQFPITIILEDHYKKPTTINQVVISNNFYNEHYRLLDQNYEPIGYLVRFLNKNQVKNENVYALTILYRQFLEFSYKVYDSKYNLKSSLNNNLSGGINFVNNHLKNSKEDKLKDINTRSVGSKVNTSITLIQENAHNIKEISPIDLISLQQALEPFLNIILKDICL